MLFLNVNAYLISLLTFNVVIFFFKFFFLNFFLFDFFFKICNNDPIVAFYNFFWITNFTVPAFIFVLLIIQFFFVKINMFAQFNISLFYLIYLTELETFFTTNFFFNLFSQTTIELNFFLNNSLNKYHPFLLYESVVLFFFIYGFKLQNLKMHKIIIFFSNIIIFVNLIALFLGAWWAAQEGSWGGWWNWDPSETLGLIIFTTNLILIHFYTIKNLNNFFFYLFSIVSLIFFLIIYFFVQLNFETTSHNFGIKFFFFFNNNFFLFEIIGFLCILLIFIKILFNFYFFAFKYLTFKFKNFYVKKLINFLFLINFSLIIIYLSFANVINFFCYNLFSFIILTIEIKLFFFFYLFLFLFLFLWQLFNNIIKCVFFFFIKKFFIFTIYFKFNFFFFLLHYLLFLIINNFFFIEKFNYAIFLTFSILNEVQANLHESFTNYNVNSLNEFYVHKNKLTYYNNYSEICSFSSINFYLFNTIGVQHLFFSSFHFLTNFYINTNYSLISLLIDMKYGENLFAFFFIFLLITVTY